MLLTTDQPQQPSPIRLVIDDPEAVRFVLSAAEPVRALSAGLRLGLQALLVTKQPWPVQEDSLR